MDEEHVDAIVSADSPRQVRASRIRDGGVVADLVLGT